jgi:hypothetical protein
MEGQDRAPYTAPRLIVYGTVEALTQTSLTMNMNDPTNSATTMT